MSSMISPKLRISVTAIGNTATIFLAGYFSFAAHRDFKAAYKEQLDDSNIGEIVVNLADVKYLDSSALGMLLVLREHAQAANKPLRLSSQSSIVARTFDIANFDKLFNIN